MIISTTRDTSISVTGILDNIGPFNEVPQEYNKDDSKNALEQSRILVVGAGGLGCEILKDLCMSGFKRIHIIDMDTIDLSNLNRQFLFRSCDVGKSKAQIAASFMVERVQDHSLQIIPHFCKIQEQPISFYKQFDIVICGLDSVEARRWINATIVSLVDSNLNNFIPIIDGGTEGFRGQSRVIYPRITSCFECTLDMLSPKTTYPICTIANTPRLPEHCIEWAAVLRWQAEFPNKKLDPDIADDFEWVYENALKRARNYGIDGVTKSLTLGVIKNIIPAIASTNAIIAASCCNEAFKYLTNSNPVLNNYMMYSGDDSIFTYTYPHLKKDNCPVCGISAKLYEMSPNLTLLEFIDEISQKQHISMNNSSLSTANKQLYIKNEPSLEKATRPNLYKMMKELVSDGEEIIVSAIDLPVELRLVTKFTK